MAFDKMTLSELLAWLEKRMARNGSAGVGWYAGETEAVRAELKKRCEAMDKNRPTFDELFFRCPACMECVSRTHEFCYRCGCPKPPACPCPVVGVGKTELGYPTGSMFQGYEILLKGASCWNRDYEYAKSRFNKCYHDWIMAQPGAAVGPVVGEGESDPSVCIIRQPVLIRCPKCDKWHQRPLGPTEGCANRPCPACQASKPDAPKGYEHVNEWREVELGEWFLNSYGEASKNHGPGWVNSSIDGGKRWILREKPKGVKCPKCGQEQSWPTEPAPTLGQEQMWFKAATTQPCPECRQNCPPAPAGHEYTGVWGKPKQGQHYLSITGDYAVCNLGAFGAPSQNFDQGRRWILKKVEEKCPKCGRGWPEIWHGKLNPCPACITNKPDTPSGFKHVEEWRIPEDKEWFLTKDGEAVQRTAIFDLTEKTDCNCRWILRKVEEEPKAGDISLGGMWTGLRALIRRVEQLEGKS